MASSHQKNLQFLTTEIFKLKNWVPTGWTEDIFQFIKLYDLRNYSILLRKRRAVCYGTESLSSLAPLIWKLIPPHLKMKLNNHNSKLKSKYELLANVHVDCVKNIRSSHLEVFLRKDVLKICSKFTGEHPCRSAISVKLQSNFIEIAFRHGYSPLNLLHIFRTPFPRNTSRWLLLKCVSHLIMVSFKLLLWFYFTVIFNACVFYLFYEMVLRCYHKNFNFSSMLLALIWL